jgi:hypothetical protein
MSGFATEPVFKPSSKFDIARKQKNGADNLTKWFEDNKTEASKMVMAIKTQGNNGNFEDYDFFKWVVFYCEVKDTIIQLGGQCIVDRPNDIDIMQNRGIVKNNIYSNVFMSFVRSLFPQFNDLLSLVLSKGYPGRDLYPSPLLMFEDIIDNHTHPLFGDYIEGEKLGNYGVLSPPKFQNSTYQLIVTKAGEISEYIRNTMFKVNDTPNSSVSYWVQHIFVPQYALNQNTNKDIPKVAKFVAEINENQDTLNKDIISIFKYALLIELNSHYQNVSDWTTQTLITPQFSSQNIQRTERTQRHIDTAWKFYSEETDKIKDFKERLYAYDDYFWNIEFKRYGSPNGPSPQDRARNRGGNGVGGSKTKRQRKQRQRKQRQIKPKSKRKKN